MPFDPILVALFEGLVETKHPFSLMATAGVKDLLATHVRAAHQDARGKAFPVLKKLVLALRTSLASPVQEVYKNALAALR